MSTTKLVEAVYETRCDKCGALYDPEKWADWSQLHVMVGGSMPQADIDLCKACRSDFNRWLYV
jgi:hypothetical protein